MILSKKISIMKPIITILFSFFITTESYSQNFVKFKHKDSKGNILYYKGYENSDIIETCKLYYIPRGSNEAQSIKVISKEIIHDEFIGTYCEPKKIQLNGTTYKIVIDLQNYIDLTDSYGNRIRFKAL